MFDDLMLNNPDWSEVFAPNGVLLKEGQMIHRNALARTLAQVASEGADALYKVRPHLYADYIIIDALMLRI